MRFFSHDGSVNSVNKIAFTISFSALRLLMEAHLKYSQAIEKFSEIVTELPPGLDSGHVTNWLYYDFMIFEIQI
jgi:hypothetical protein